MKQLDAPPSGEELKEIRLAYNMTKKEMGEVLGVTATTVTSYETGKTRIPYRHVKRINRLLAKPVPTDEPVPATPEPKIETAHVTPVPADEPAHVKQPEITLEELRFLRRSRGLTQKQVAKAYGVSHTSIYAYEHGQASIPKGLADCIKGMAEPKGDLLTSGEATAPYTLHDILQLIAQSRTEEHDHWLRIGDELTPTELRQFRHARGLSEAQLAESLGIATPTHHRYENGSIRIPKGFMAKIISIFPYRSITPTELLLLRNSAGLSQAQISDVLGVTKNAYQHYEAGTRKITWDLSNRLMEAFLAMAQEPMSDGDHSAQQ